MPPPGGGLVAATRRDPTCTSADDGMEIVICVPLSSLGLNDCPPKVAIASSTKLLPLIVRVMEGDPAKADGGENDDTVGRGLLMTNCAAGESSPAKVKAQAHVRASLQGKRVRPPLICRRDFTLLSA